MRPLSILRDVLDAYRRHWAVLLATALPVFALANIVESFVSELQVDRLHGHALMAALGLGIAAVALSSLGEGFYEGVTTVTVEEWRSKTRRARLLAVARNVRYVPLIITNAIVAVGVGVGLVLAVVPGFVFGTYAALAPALVEIEQHGVRAALRRSVELVRGHFWPVAILLWGVFLLSNAAAAGLEGLLHSVTLEGVSKTVVESVLAPFYGLAAVLTAHALREA